MKVSVFAHAAIASVSMLTLASCSSGGFLGSTDASPASAPRTAPQAAPARTQQAALPSQPVREAAPQADPARKHPLAGLSAQDLKSQWGEPTLTRTDGTAQTWQFAGANCTVLAYLYPTEGGALKTRYVEARPGGEGEDAIRSCLKGGRRGSADAGLADPVADGARSQPKLRLKPAN